MSDPVQESCCCNRAELYETCRHRLGNAPEADRALPHFFWENAWCGNDGEIKTFYAPLPVAVKRINVQSFDAPKYPEIERSGDFLRLCVTTNWVLDMARFGSLDNWFASLSQKNRKNLPLFESVHRVFDGLSEQKKSFSFLLLDAKDEPVAAILGYLNGKSFFFTHLPRHPGRLDKFSPGTFLTYSLVEKLFLEHPEVHYFFMGPGKYDYKPAFLAEPLTVYRYEKKSIFNLSGLLRFRHRLKKERKKFAVQTE